MNEAHLHLIVNHFPIVGLFIGIIILAVGIGFKFDNSKRTGLFIIIGSVIASYISFETGEGAEEIIEGLPAISEKLIHEHEEMAEFFMGTQWMLLLVSLITFFLDWKQKKIAHYAYILLLILSCSSMYFAKKVGTSGGEITHVEIRENFKLPAHDSEED